MEASIPLTMAEDFLLDKLEENAKELMEYFAANKQQIIDSFTEKFIELCKLTRQQQESGLKAPIAFVHIASLRSSLLTETYEFRISMFDNRFWLDTVETAVYWKGDFFFRHVEPDIAEISKQLKAQASVPEYEIHEFRYRYALCYLLPPAQAIIEEIAAEALKAPAFAELMLDENIAVIFGGHMEGGGII